MQLWDIDGGRLASSVPLPDGMAAHNMAFAPDGRSVWVLGGLLQGDGKAWDRKTHLWRIDPATGGALLHRPFGSEMSLALAVSPDGARVAVATANGEMQVHATDDGRTLARFKSQRGLGESLASAIGGPQERHVRQLRFSPDGRQLLATEALQRSEVWDIASGTLLRELPLQAADYLPDGSLLAGGTGVLKLLAPPPSGAQATWWEHDYTRSLGVDTIIHHIKASASGGLAAVARESAIELWSVSERRVVKTLRSATGGMFDGAGMQFSADGTRLVVTSGQDTRIWSMGKGEELVRLLELGDGEWVAITPQGYFSASSPKAADAITIKHEGQLMALGQFYEAFYRPDLVLAALSGQEVPVLPSGSMAGVLGQLPPKVARVTLDGPTTGATVKVRYALNVQAGGLGDVRLYHNGKLVRWDRGQGQSVQPGTALAAAAPAGSGRGLAAFGEEGWDQQLRGLARAPAQQAPGPLAALAATEGVVELPTVPGRNEVSVLAFNANNTVASQAGQLRFDSALPVSPPSLYMLAVGINEYADARARLKYAAKDAADVLDQFAAKAGRLYGQGRVHITKLIDREATREKIIASLDELARSARPTDHVMLFVAGHGVLVNGGYHMVAANFDGVLSPGNTISAEEIVDRSRQIPALSQWLVFDTCHAGGLGDLLRGLHDSRVQVLARQSGMHVFAAASTSEEALDGYEGNGLFTHSLLDGIGNALSADANADRQVSIVELGAFTQARTRELARRLKHRQEPVIVHHGDDRFVAK